MRTSAILTLAWASCAAGGMYQTSTDYNGLLAKFQAGGGVLTKFGAETDGMDDGRLFTNQPFSTPNGWTFNNHVLFDAGAHSTIDVASPKGDRSSLQISSSSQPASAGTYNLSSFGDLLNATAASGDGRWVFLASSDSGGVGSDPSGNYVFDAVGRKFSLLYDYLTHALDIPAAGLPRGFNDQTLIVPAVLGSNATGSVIFGRSFDGYFLAQGDVNGSGGSSPVPEPTVFATLALAASCCFLRRAIVRQPVAPGRVLFGEAA